MNLGGGESGKNVRGGGVGKGGPKIGENASIWPLKEMVQRALGTLGAVKGVKRLGEKKANGPSGGGD